MLAVQYIPIIYLYECSRFFSTRVKGAQNNETSILLYGTMTTNHCENVFFASNIVCHIISSEIRGSEHALYRRNSSKWPIINIKIS